jgi:hypothetical protein
MLFTTPTQWAALALVLLAGWLLGLASSSGGRRWRDRYNAEREAHLQLRRDGDTRLSQANARVAELERENARLASAAPVATTVTGRPVVATTAARPAYPAGERRGWFDWGTRPRTTV